MEDDDDGGGADGNDVIKLLPEWLLWELMLYSSMFSSV